jgi:hypothetical protein
MDIGVIEDAIDVLNIYISKLNLLLDVGCLHNKMLGLLEMVAFSSKRDHRTVVNKNQRRCLDGNANGLE